MTREDIRTQFPEATKEQIDAILNIHSADIGKAKGDTQTLTQRVSELEAQLATARTELENAKKTAGDVDALNQKITQLTQDVSERDSKITRMQTDYGIKDAIRQQRARDVDIVFGLLDTSKIAQKNGKYTGLEEQLKTIRETKGFLFESEEKPQPSRGGFDGKQDILGGEQTGGVNAAMNNALRAATGRTT